MPKLQDNLVNPKKEPCRIEEIECTQILENLLELRQRKEAHLVKRANRTQVDCRL